MENVENSRTEAPHGLLPPELPADGMSRRRFLSLVSASAALALGTSSCSRADRGKVVPYTKRPEEVLPGVATYYASTFQEGVTTWGVLVKTREGRPIHIEGNEEHPGARVPGRREPSRQTDGKGETESDGESGSPAAGLDATAPLRAVADILGLYDPDRLRGPIVEGKPSDWTAALDRVAKALKDCAADGKGVLLLTPAHLSPSRRALLEVLARAVPTLRPVAWEPAASDPEIVSARRAFGEWRIATPRLDRARTILALEADILGTDPAASRAIAAFAARRRPRGPTDSMPRLWAVEGRMTLTGANADERIAARPSAMAALAFALARVLHEEHGLALPSGLGREVLADFDLDEVAGDLGPGDATATSRRLRALAADLESAGKTALVVAGSSLPPQAHVAAHLLNGILGAEGSTVDAATAPPSVALATTSEVRGILEEAARGAFGAAIFWGVNPAYAIGGDAWKAATEKIPFRARIALHDDETAAKCEVVLAESHWLESWGDHEPTSDILSLQQPAVAALHDTRQGEEAILAILGLLGIDRAPDYLSFIRKRWEREVYPLAAGTLGPAGGAGLAGGEGPVAGEGPAGKEGDGDARPISFDAFWNVALHDGVFRRKSEPGSLQSPRSLRAEAVEEAAAAARREGTASRGGLELVLGPGAATHDGRYAQNGWLQELPDPITKVTWGNPIALSAADAETMGVMDGDVLRLEVDGESLEAPALLQPGQAPGVLSIALGYGRARGAVAAGVGANAFRLVDARGPAPFLRTGVRASRVGRSEAIARTQEHHRMEGRDLARSWTLQQYAGRSHDGSAHDGSSHDGSPQGKGPGAGHGHELHTLLREMDFPDQKWGMAIDLSACVGCSACVIACQSENNVPVVGPEQVIRSREMHWLRIDRYYEGDPAAPRTVHQPVLCQQCDNAPCETVCPVNATTHSPDGLNQMTYNRCVGTRYCANNCPYKVRRFNFFDYTATKREPETLAFNPEVTVRPRGVMEKCTFCVQRIQDARFRAKAGGRPLADGDIRPACAVACPSRAIVFGDLKDPRSAVSELSRSDRGYKLLEELGVRPAVTYLARVTNPLEVTTSREVDDPARGTERAGDGGSR